MTSEAKNSEYYESYQGEKKIVAKPAHYLELYNKYFADLADKELSILELGIFDGHSLEYFSKMFPKSKVLGVDINKCERAFSSDRVIMHQGSQDDPALFQKIMVENGVKHFDIIIDDCSHIGSLTLDSFNILYPFLSPGGLYVIEDWGMGYWSKAPGGMTFRMQNHLKRKRLFPEWIPYLFAKLYGRLPIRAKFFGEYFKSHQFGIPGVIKQLVDEVAMGDITDQRGLSGNTPPKIRYLHIYPGISFMQKV